MSCTVENDNNYRPIVNESFKEDMKGLRVGGDSECKSSRGDLWKESARTQLYGGKLTLMALQCLPTDQNLN